MDGLERFLSAQDGVYSTALAELRAGRKRTHWMWFIFPQLAGSAGQPWRNATASPPGQRRVNISSILS